MESAARKEIATSSTPVKETSSSRRMPTRSTVADDILTPEKTAETRRRIKNRGGVAYSVKEVREVAAGLRRSHPEAKVSSDPTVGEKRKRPAPKIVPKLEEKYEVLLEFFKSLCSSIRLLRMKGYPSSFSKISRQVESLTNRRFSYGHLAQIKHVLPEAVCIRKFLTLDETTSIAKPDIQITLRIDAFDEQPQIKGNGYHKLAQIFRSRLVDFINEHPGEEDIPEADLPEPFNQKREIIPSPPLSSPTSVSIDDPSNAMASSHLPSSFQRRFSRSNLPSSFHLPSSSVESSKEIPPSKTSSLLKSVPERTPSKVVATPKATPETPQRQCLPSRRPTKTKLFNTPEKGEDDLLQFLPKSLLHSIREKEKRCREEEEEGLPEAKRRHKMLATLPRLFDTLLLLFQSAKCSVITRQELVYKIVAGQCDVVDRREAEERLDLLLELLPDWISSKTASTGDTLFRVNKTSDSGDLRRRLAEAR